MNSHIIAGKALALRNLEISFHSEFFSIFFLWPWPFCFYEPQFIVFHKHNWHHKIMEHLYNMAPPGYKMLTVTVTSRYLLMEMWIELSEQKQGCWDMQRQHQETIILCWIPGQKEEMLLSEPSGSWGCYCGGHNYCLRHSIENRKKQGENTPTSPTSWLLICLYYPLYKVKWKTARREQECCSSEGSAFQGTEQKDMGWWWQI